MSHWVKQQRFQGKGQNREVKMNHLSRVKWCIACSLLLALLSCVKRDSTQSNSSQELYWRETIVAGAPHQFMEVHHILLKGSNYAIGKKIAEIARANHIHLTPTGDALRNRVQREYMQQNYPVLFERMKGLADGYGIAIGNNDYDCSTLSQFPRARPGCSVVFYPGTETVSTHSILSRNYDFTTGTFQGKRPQEHEMAVMSRPYIFELYPDQGYASLSICAFDLLGGVLDGINSEGLAVAILGDDETIASHGLEPSRGIGMHELMSMRYVLDTCKDVEGAKRALLSANHYYSFIPCHYILADRTGRSFVFEFSSNRNSVHCIDGQGPQWVTNHLLSKFPTMDQFPEESMLDSFERYRKLHDSIHGENTFSIEDIKAINASVASSDMDSNSPEYAPHRTLWHSIYDLEERSVQVTFYLGEGKVDIQYSEYLTLQLEPGK